MCICSFVTKMDKHHDDIFYWTKSDQNNKRAHKCGLFFEQDYYRTQNDSETYKRPTNW